MTDPAGIPEHIRDLLCDTPEEVMHLIDGGPHHAGRLVGAATRDAEPVVALCKWVLVPAGREGLPVCMACVVAAGFTTA